MANVQDVPAHQIAFWDIEPENISNHSHVYVEVFACDNCGDALPYSNADHQCTAADGEDEGFEESIRYHDRFVRFCERSANNPYISLVKQCECGNLHGVYPEAIGVHGNNAGNQPPVNNGNQPRANDMDIRRI